MLNHAEVGAWGIINVSGPEAIAFLQTQFTQSVNDLAEHEIRQAGFCTAKGRLLGTFFVLKTSADSLMLVTRRDLIESLVKRLNMFKLRMKCVIEDVSNNFTMTFSIKPAELLKDKWKPIDGGYELLFTGGQQAGVMTLLEGNTAGEPVVARGDSEFQAWLINHGKAYICRSVVERYTPQEINMDLTGGVSFQKGCYPGQEIVARSHYLGKVKRRSFIARIASLDTVEGDDVWQIGKTNEPAGTVVALGEDSQGRIALVELPAPDALHPDSKFSVESPDSSSYFGVIAPPYDVLSKGQ